MKLSKEQIDYCMECGVCTGSCPVSRVIETFSPRQMIKRALLDQDESVLHGKDLWACLTCARCSVRCPVAIDFPEFARLYRSKARDAGNFPQYAHHGTLQTIAALQTRGVQQHRTEWARESGTFQSGGEYFFFVGCAPYFDATLPFGSSSLDTARSVLRLFNRMGIDPVISDDERCCGHDALWSGDEAVFRKLAERNLEVIRGAGAKTVVFSCPEGYTLFKQEIPKTFGELPFEVMHVSEFLARELPGSGLSFKPPANGGNHVVTYQDPCRLGRKAGIYEAPREIIGLIPEIRLEEMGRNRENALCCGTSAWIECSNCSKAMQIERLEEARAAGAETVLTACPKCRIHLTCAQQNTDLKVNVDDLYTFVLNHIA
jgi:heterodisulfide reductase subunit D